MDISRRNSKLGGLDSFLTGLNKGIIMDMNRNKRKNGARDHEPSEFSQQSILSAMDRFVQAVNNMDDTIMVPSRLLDMPLQGEGVEMKDPKDRSSSSGNVMIPRVVTNTDLYSFYNMLNSVKTELIWGTADADKETSNAGGLPGGLPGNQPSTPTTVVGGGGGNGKLTARRMSTVSMHSYSDSDVESESSTEFDSGVDLDEQSLRIANAFRQHLSGLFHSLHQLTDAANYLTSRYQEEVGGSS